MEKQELKIENNKQRILLIKLFCELEKLKRIILKNLNGTTEIEQEKLENIK